MAGGRAVSLDGEMDGEMAGGRAVSLDGEDGCEAVSSDGWLVVELSAGVLVGSRAVKQWSYASIKANIPFEKKAILSLF